MSSKVSITLTSNAVVVKSLAERLCDLAYVECQ